MCVCVAYVEGGSCVCVCICGGGLCVCVCVAYVEGDCVCGGDMCGGGGGYFGSFS